MTNFDYPEPVSQLLTLGDCRQMREWPDYQALGIGPDHIPDLIRIVEDDELNWADSESLEVWAPVHAWRALGQLRAETAVEALIGRLGRIDEYDDDWAGEVPDVLGMIGPVAVPKLDKYLLAPGEGLWARVGVAHALAEVGKHHPEARDDCVAALVRALEAFAQQDPTFNGFIASYLVDLKAVETAPLMEKAFAADCVDISIQGDWEDTQIRLGLLDERQTPKPHYVWLPDPGASPPQRPPQTPPKQPWKQEQKAKRRQKEERRAKRKQQRKARKKQRKRK